MKLKIKDGFIMRKIGGKNIIVASGEVSQQFNGMININDVGAYLWTLLEKDITEDGLVEAITEKYDVDEEKARRDVRKFVEKLENSGFLE